MLISRGHRTFRDTRDRVQLLATLGIDLAVLHRHQAPAVFKTTVFPGYRSNCSNSSRPSAIRSRQRRSIRSSERVVHSSFWCCPKSRHLGFCPDRRQASCSTSSFCPRAARKAPPNSSTDCRSDGCVSLDGAPAAIRPSRQTPLSRYRGPRCGWPPYRHGACGHTPTPSTTSRRDFRICPRDRLATSWSGIRCRGRFGRLHPGRVFEPRISRRPRDHRATRDQRPKKISQSADSWSGHHLTRSFRLLLHFLKEFFHVGFAPRGGELASESTMSKEGEKRFTRFPRTSGSLENRSVALRYSG